VCAGTVNGLANIAILNTPTATINGSTSICEGLSANLNVAFTGASPWNFSYTDGTTTTPITGITVSPYVFSVNPAANTNYTLSTVTDDVCAGTGSGSAQITVSPKPDPTFTYTDTAYCKSGLNPLTNISTGTFTAVPSISFANTATGEIDISTISVGNYTITNTMVASGGCEASTYVDRITIANQPNASLSIVGTTDKSITVCDTEHKSIWLHLEGVRPITIKMGVNNFEKDTTINTALNNFLFKVSPNVTSQYKLLSISDQACKTPVSLTEIININVKQSNGTTQTPTLATSGSYTNCSANTLKLYISNPENGATYQWYRNQRLVVNETASSMNVYTYGDYTVNEETCLPSAKSIINRSSFETSPSLSVSATGNTKSITTSSVDGATYQWYVNDYKILGATSNTLSTRYNGEYKVSVTTNNCHLFSQPLSIAEPTFMEARAAGNAANDSTISTTLGDVYSVMPNPSKGVIHLIGLAQSQAYAMFIRDLSGNIVYQNAMSDLSEHQISFLPTGLYIVELVVKNQSYFIKLAKEE
jgi:hypothetical protein